MKRKSKTGWIKSRDTIQELITSSSDNININFNDTDIIEQIKQNLDDENVEKILKQASASEIELVVSEKSSDEIKARFNYKIYMAETYKKNKENTQRCIGNFEWVTLHRFDDNNQINISNTKIDPDQSRNSMMLTFDLGRDTSSITLNKLKISVSSASDASSEGVNIMNLSPDGIKKKYSDFISVENIYKKGLNDNGEDFTDFMMHKFGVFFRKPEQGSSEEYTKLFNEIYDGTLIFRLVLIQYYTCRCSEWVWLILGYKKQE